MRIVARVSDNVLDDKDWPVVEADVEGGVVVRRWVVNKGAYGTDTILPVGMTVSEICEWTRHDGTGRHPEQYYELRIGGRFKDFVTLEEIEQCK